MPDLRKHPLYNHSHEGNAALINACGRVFAAAHAREGTSSAAERDRSAEASVRTFLDTLAKD